MGENILQDFDNQYLSDDVYEPLILDPLKETDKKYIVELKQQAHIRVLDTLDGQLRELIKIQNPTRKIKDDEYEELVANHLGNTNATDYGVWVYYAWSGFLVHLLPEDEFVETRTNRNRYKLTKAEQEYLQTQKIGIIGLSVGQSIALTIAMERICGEIRLADFDTVELSNLNRIRTGLQNLGIKKTVLAAREIAEIDPFINVKLYSDGINDENIDEFFTANGKLDLLVEVCDGLNIKIQSRFKARELEIPVLMDTNDRGMLDVERFDLEPDRPILHGLAGDLNPEMIKDLTNEQKIPYILKMIGAETISTRLKASMMEVEQTINTWPQLASSVVLGGGLTTDTARRILLGQFNDSGRYYIDFEDLIQDKKEQSDNIQVYQDDPPAELKKEDLLSIANGYTSDAPSEAISDKHLKEIVTAAGLAPSGGNSQPWKFLYKDNRLYVFHDVHYSYSLLDFNNLGSYLGFGAMLENIRIAAAHVDISVTEDIFPLQEDKRLVYVISFENKAPNYQYTYLKPAVTTRVTNRVSQPRTLISQEHKAQLQGVIKDIEGAKLLFFESDDEIAEFADILTTAEKVRSLTPRGHYDTFVKELRFTDDEVISTRDGLDIKTLNMSNSDKAALQIARDEKAISFLHRENIGDGFKKISEKAVKSAGCICVMTMDGDSQHHFMKGGRAVERVWLEATELNISMQPISQIIFLIQRYHKNGGKEFNDHELNQLKQVNARFNSLLTLSEDRYPVFVFRLLYADIPDVRSLRKPLKKLLFINKQ